MPLGRQPRRARGTLEHPNSAIGLRVVLASFGVIVCGVAFVLLLMLGHAVPAYVFLALGIVALIDLVVVTARLTSRR